MADDRSLAYATALFAVAQAEGTLSDVEDELFRFSRLLQGSDELRGPLTDGNIPVDRRQQIIEDLLGDKSSPTTIALISMVVGTGRARDLPEIIDELVKMSAAEGGKEVAEVRSAIELTAEQQQRLAEALGQRTGKSVEVKVVVDESILGGVVAQVGDTVIDGSIRHRLDQLKNQF